MVENLHSIVESPREQVANASPRLFPCSSQTRIPNGQRVTGQVKEQILTAVSSVCKTLKIDLDHVAQSAVVARRSQIIPNARLQQPRRSILSNASSSNECVVDEDPRI